MALAVAAVAGLIMGQATTAAQMAEAGARVAQLLELLARLIQALEAAAVSAVVA
jgi:succinyl-CoA synthetase alpha subunit